MPADTSAIGVVGAPSSTYVESFERNKKLNKNAQLRASDGSAAEDTDFDPMTEFTVRGKGDLTSGIAAGATVASDESVLVGAAAGKTVIKETTESDKASDYNEFSFSAENWPSGV